MKSTQFGIENDPFFNDLFFKSGLASRFQQFNESTKLDYPVDAWYDDQNLVFEIPVLNASKDDIKITKTSDLLRITYKRSNRPDDENRTWVKRSIVKRDFNLEWRITSKFNANEITSTFSNGLLIIQIPFAKEAKPEVVEIKDAI